MKKIILIMAVWCVLFETAVFTIGNSGKVNPTDFIWLIYLPSINNLKKIHSSVNGELAFQAEAVKFSENWDLNYGHMIRLWCALENLQRAEAISSMIGCFGVEYNHAHMVFDMKRNDYFRENLYIQHRECLECLRPYFRWAR